MRKIAILLALALCFSFALLSCNSGQNKNEAESTEKLEAVDISKLELSEYITLGKYSGLRVEYNAAETEKTAALWEEIVKNTTVKKYPEEQVEYYYSQQRAKYSYMAKTEGESYEDILLYLGVTEESMLNEARRMTLDDLIAAAIQKAESIELTETEKLENFDAYLNVFTEVYGYSEEYVREKLTDELYDTMLHDKMMEKLLLVNELVIIE